MDMFKKPVVAQLYRFSDINNRLVSDINNDGALTYEVIIFSCSSRDAENNEGETPCGSSAPFRKTKYLQ